MDTIFILGAALVFYGVILFPQLKKRREVKELMASLAEGDEVVMSSGMHGIISALDESIVYVEVSDGVEIKFSRTAIASKLPSDLDIIS